MEIRRILFPTDFSGCSKQALDSALLFAEAFEAELHMLHAVLLHDADPLGRGDRFPDAPELYNRVHELAASEMAALLTPHKGRPLTFVQAHQRGVAAGEVILEYIDEWDIDLVVMGTHGRRPATRLLLGSVAEEVVRHASCSVLTLRELDPPRAPKHIETILVPVDFSAGARQGFAAARHLAKVSGASITLLHVVELPIYPDVYGLPVPSHSAIELAGRADQALQVWARECGEEIACEVKTINGRPGREIVAVAEQGYDLVVMASHGRKGIERLLLGSTAEQVVHRATCPVLTIKAEEE